MVVAQEPIEIEVTDQSAYVDGEPIELADGQSAEAAAIAGVAALARELGRPLRAIAHEPHGVDVHLLVQPDGTSDLVPVVSPYANHTVPDPVVVTRDSLTAEDLIRPTDRETRHRARHGWRGALARRTGLPLQPSSREAAYLEDLDLAQTQLGGPRTIMCVNPKGGAAKTTSALMLAATLGVARGGGVLAWDISEGRGTMGSRCLRSELGGTARTLLEDAALLSSAAGRLGDLDRYVHTQGSARFDVLPADDRPDLAASISTSADFTTLHQLLQRFYRIIVLDTATNIRTASWRAAAEAADLLVISTTVREDAGGFAAWMIDALENSEHAALVANAVTLIHQSSQRADPDLREHLEKHFAGRTRAVVHIPWEPSLAAGGPIDYDALSPAGTRAWLRAAATAARHLTSPVPQPDPTRA